MVTALIIIGSIIMVGNIIAYVRFIRTSTDVMLSGKHGEPIWENIGLALLVFFLLGWFFGCIIAELIDKRKAILEWLKR